jgi:predicted nuclease of predicted toxin-antitoxin system
MIRLATDENFLGPITAGLLRRNPGIDLVRVQDTGMAGADDPTLLEWCASQGRVLVTHDAATLVGFAYDRVRAGKPMPGLIEVRLSLPVATAIEELLLLAECSQEGEWDGQVIYLPL